MDNWHTGPQPKAPGARSGIRIFWIDRGRFSTREFESLPAAVAYAQSQCSSASFHRRGELLASWDAVGGYKSYLPAWRSALS